MRCVLAIAVLSAMLGVPSTAAAKDAAGPVVSHDLRVKDKKGNPIEKKRYFLIGHHLPKDGDKKPPKKFKEPKDGFKLLVVLPGGGGGEDFNGFVTNIHRQTLDKDWLVVQLVAPKWVDKQNFIWPTDKKDVKQAKFLTQDLFLSVFKEVSKRFKIDKKVVFTLSWSSGGPAAYYLSLMKKTPVTGSFVSMSVFKPHRLPSLKAAKGKAYYIHHSPEDKTCPLVMAHDARDRLRKKGAKVEFATYEGGHGWHGNMWGQMRKGFKYLQKPK